ncbi:MAG: DUF4416 family protein [Thermodesulfobacteriota bacterium]
MSIRSVPASARLLISAIYREERDLEAAIRRIEEKVGAVRPAGPAFPFDRTDYYAAEMGSPLFRRFLRAEEPVPRDALPDIKIALERIEVDLSIGDRRTVNLDPGLITPENFILATGKNFTHRVYLRDGVFADLTLVFRKGEYRPLPWTYPDYASDEIRRLLRELRREHMASGVLC